MRFTEYRTTAVERATSTHPPNQEIKLLRSSIQAFVDSYNYDHNQEFECDGDGNEMKSVILYKWLVIVTSCLFISLISWDIVGDKEGWYGGIWVPLSGFGMLILLWFLDYLLVILNIKLKDPMFLVLRKVIVAT